MGPTPLPSPASTERKLSAAKGEVEKVFSGKRASFSKGPYEKVGQAGLNFDTENLIQALCKPWELGGHPHDFLVCHRSTRSTDPYQHYEQDKLLLLRHERLVAEKESWNRQRKLRQDMLHLLTRLHSIERQRRQFIERRRQNHPEAFEQVPDDFKEENENIKLGAINLAERYFQKRPSQLPLLSPRKQVAVRHEDEPPPTDRASIGYEEKVVVNIPTPATVAARQEVQDLDAFDNKLSSMFPPAAGANSFKKKK